MPADRDVDRIFDVSLAPEDIAFWEEDEGDRQSLVDLINRVLDRGVVITGDVTISVAGVDLVYLGLSAVLTSVQTARDRMDSNAGPDRLPPRSGDG
jgi:gas vesicle structural protein